MVDLRNNEYDDIFYDDDNDSVDDVKGNDSDNGTNDLPAPVSQVGS